MNGRYWFLVAKPVTGFTQSPASSAEERRLPERGLSARITPQNGAKARLPLFQAVSGDTTSTLSEIRSAKLDLYRAARIVTATIKSSVRGAAILTRKETHSALRGARWEMKYFSLKEK